MKYLRTLLCLTVISFVATWSIAQADSYDSETATVQKKSDSMAKIMVGKDTFTTPVKFDDGADWSSVKDHYEMNPAAVSGLKSGSMMISVGSDGTLTYKPCTCSSSKKKK